MKRIMHIYFRIAIVFSLVLSGAGTCMAAAKIAAMKSDSKIIIDGMEQEQAWGKIKPLIFHDPIADIDITMKVLYNEKDLFMLVSFPDSSENKVHKSWVWDAASNIYKMGRDREDIFIIKWFMESEPEHLSLYSGKPQTADIWFWKANRTNPVGYADDKIHYLQAGYEKNATEIIASNGSKLYLLRKGDQGGSAYSTKVPFEYKGEKVHRFENRIPTGSRSDVKARGSWQNGRWTIEFQRALKTGHKDDLNLDVKKTYTFGVSRYEIAGHPPGVESDEPLYGSGDTRQGITISFEQ
jgi:hypothetical protein